MKNLDTHRSDMQLYSYIHIYIQEMNMSIKLSLTLCGKRACAFIPHII